MHVAILGPLQLTDAGTVVEVGGARLRALLVRLAAEPGGTVSAGALSEALWPGEAPADPVNAVQSLVSRLRKVLPAGATVVPVSGGYRLDLPPDAVDLIRFERLVAEGRRSLRAGDPAAAVPPLREALGLWRGEPLSDIGAAPFASALAARLEELRLTAAEDLAEAELASGGGADLVARLGQLVAAHPLRERLRALQVRALTMTGRRAEALAAFEAARGALADQLGSDPGPGLREAHLAALRDDEHPPARPANTLPRPLTTLIGRDDERAQVRGALHRSRLVTLVGPGGTGKTRLATEVGADLAGETAGGVWLVELGALADPADIAPAIADMLHLAADSGLTVAGTRPPDALTRIIEAIGTSDTVVVLDNCEHLVDAVAPLAETLLRRCLGLRVLATSREPLRVAGEALHEVPPLTEADAIRLFTQRARDIRPDAVSDGSDRPVAAEICRRLDGLPLAIELAAARLRTLPLAELARRLGDRFDVLSHGTRTAPARHRTLRDVVAWSWELLDAGEQRFLSRLAVLPGTVSADAAARVGDDAGAPDLLAALVDKSLLQLVDGPRPRYRMLETIREFAADRLAATGELAGAQAALVDYATELAERAEPHLRTGDQLVWLARLRDEHDTLGAAMRCAERSGDGAAALRLAAALAQYWTVRSDHSRATGRLRQALHGAGSGAAAEYVAVVATYQLLNAAMSGELPDAAAIADLVTGRVDELCAASSHPAVTLLRPLLALVADEVDDGVALADELLATEDPWTRGSLLLVRSLLGGAHGDMVEACDRLAEAAHEFGAAGERWGRMTALTFLAIMRTMFGDTDAAAALQEAVRLRRELEPDDDAVEQRAWLAQLVAWTGDEQRARADLLELVRPVAGRPARYVILAQVVLGDLARGAGDLADADRWYRAADDGVRASGESMFVAVLETSRAQLAVAAGDLDGAAKQLRSALGVALDIRDLPLAAAVAVGVAAMLAAGGRDREAATTLGAAHGLRGAADPLNPDVIAVTERLRDRLGPDAFTAAYEHGRCLDATAATELVRSYTRR